MVKCNMTPEEQEKALALFTNYRSTEELEKSKSFFERFLFFETWGRRNFREYFCPECGLFEIERPYGGFDVYQDDPFMDHHGDRVECPYCHQTYTLICLGRMRNMSSLRRTERVAFFRAVNGVLTVSAGTAEMNYSMDDLDPYPNYRETARYVVEPGKRQMWRPTYKWTGYPTRYEVSGWEAKKTFVEPFARTHYMGISIIPGEVGNVGIDAIQKTGMKYCQLYEFALRRWGVDLEDELVPVWGAIQYLGEYSARPQLEMLVKLGHEEVIQNLLENGSVDRRLVNWRAKDPAGFFRVSKKEYKALRGAKNVLFALARFREDQPEGMDLADYLETWGVMDDGAEVFFGRCKRHGLQPKKVAAWLSGQGLDLGQAVCAWDDYLTMAEKLERDMTFRRNLLPDNLMQEHDAALELLNRIEHQKEKASYKKRYAKLKREYAYSDGNLSIVVPSSAKSIEREGQALRHCVGGYADRHVKGATTILYLRKTKSIGIPYVTIEINDANHKIRQVHGYRNEADGADNPMARHKDFFDEWLEWLKQGSPRTKKGEPIRPKKTNKEAKTA